MYEGYKLHNRVSMMVLISAYVDLCMTATIHSDYFSSFEPWYEQTANDLQSPRIVCPKLGARSDPQHTTYFNRVATQRLV